MINRKIHTILFKTGKLLFILPLLMLSLPAFNQLSLTTLNTNYSIDFESSVSGVINGQFAGTGFTPSPSVGQLDSDAWKVMGLSDGTASFGGTLTTGDFARGISSGGVGTGGVYAFEVASGDRALGVQPTGDDWTPGSFVLRIQNNTGATITELSISYSIFVKNDATRANSFNFYYSTDDVSYTQVPGLDYTSPEFGSTGNPWVEVPRSETISGLSILDGTYFYLRWYGNDVSGSDTRDEFALNDIVINVDGQGSVENPVGFTAFAVSSAQINLSWSLNANNDDVLIAWNSSNTFGTPSGTYSIGQGITGGGTVLYAGSGTAVNHTSLSSNTVYFYKAWSVDGTTTYSPGVITGDTTFESEPASHPSAAAAQVNGATWITVAWTDDGSDNYLVKGSHASPQGIAPPTDLVPESNSLLVHNIPAGTAYHQFTGLDPETEYFFKIFPYNGTGTAVNYKTGGAVPIDSATTAELDLDLLITEVADPADKSFAKFVEIMNLGSAAVDLSVTPVYLCRQANGNPASWECLQMTGTLAPGDGYVAAFYDTSFASNYALTASQESPAISGNGNDGYFLYLNGSPPSGILLDAYGVIDENGTGKAWEYTDGHAVRRRGITSPNDTWTASEWIIITQCNADNMTPSVHAGDVTWQGTSSANWNERGANWSGTHGFVPDGSYNVTVPVTMNSPVVNEASACNSLSLEDGVSLGIEASGSLSVIGTIP